MKRLVWILVAVGVCAGGFLAYRAFASRKDDVPTYTTVKVDKGPIIARVTASGTVSALVTVQVGAQVSGRIAMLSADFNSQVTKGQVIAKIDPQLFQAAVAQAEANLLADLGNLNKAKIQAGDSERQYTRAKALAERKLVAQADVDTAQATFDAARANIEAAKGDVARSRAALNQTKVNLDYTNIVSPINGVVISRSVDVGQTVASALQAPTLFTIAEDLKKMQVDTNVAEADVGKLAADMAATFTVDAFPGERFRGKVRQIRNAPQTVQNVVTYDAVIDVENAELKLRPGMTANVTFIYAEKRGALRIPNAALRFRPADAKVATAPAGPAAGGAGGGGRQRDGDAGPGARGPGGGGRGFGAGGAGMGAPVTDRRQVYVLKEGKAEATSIRVGITDGTNTEVLEGLDEGDEIITDSTDAARGGSNASPPGGGGGRRLF
jgi:HlyD family secretion protein